ncbi:putative metalloprotease CJM1_0395 family protein [Chitiniphilus shinanonensis]|uniref:putative metalloprotease CJM1_0395 family protein n=1 Tax=Chitiniphilus shinanonensis TaxID=553088 RepID=UPI0012F92706|nr:putative metalloprotease CJM1_0395 family protein [Chitiniphilus shinanonensis]
MLAGTGPSSLQTTPYSGLNTSSYSTTGLGGGSAHKVGEPLSAEEQAYADKLANIDRKVRAHEQAHMAAGSGLTQGGPSYSLQTGPDGKQYAVAGEVRIDVSPGRTPEETIRKARAIQAAALAPADPSGPDRSIAAQAQAMEQQAQAELASQSGTQRQLSDAYSGYDDSMPSGFFAAQA